MVASSAISAAAPTVPTTPAATVPPTARDATPTPTSTPIMT
ncbi:MAG TPA: hypothetical protein VF095_05755 [Bacillota bacterium]